MAFWAVIWTLFHLFIIVSAYTVCNGCDCTVSEQSSAVKVVKNIFPICNEGGIRWYVHDGALGITFKPSFRGEFQLCFSINVENVHVQVSEEYEQKTLRSSDAFSKPPTLQAVVSVYDKTRELCLMSSDGYIKLFLEPERTVRSIGFGFVDIKFIMEKPNNALVFDSVEDCRPCTENELLHAYCSHDIVLVGSVNNVTHIEDITKINVQISKVVRQRRLLLQHMRKGNGPYVTEILTTQRSCDASFGPELFLFTGKWRLGQLKLKCSPYYKDWNLVLKRALLTGRMDCPV